MTSDDVLLKRNRLVKRTTDLFLSITILIPLIPILIVVSFICYLIVGSPVFYYSRRFITSERQITIVKFRSMVINADSEKHKLNQKYMQDGFLNIPLSDEIYTPLGRILEVTQLVESPQIFLVLSGCLSLVGNRPLPMANRDQIKESFPHLWEKRFEAPAGITGIAQVVGKYDLSAEQRLYLEGLYAQVFSRGNIFKADMIICWLTFSRLVLRDKRSNLDFNNAEMFLKNCLN